MEDRFISDQAVAVDRHTGLMWARNAALTEFPMTWAEALSYISELNASEFAGYKDWHLPNRRELFSLISHNRINPSVSENHPFRNIFHGYYWTSTTCSRLPTQAWYIHLGGAKVYRGMKHASYMVWPVRVAHEPVDIINTGQRDCYSEKGQLIDCTDTGQDGEVAVGRTWPAPRFSAEEETVYDRMTGLVWARRADFGRKGLNWNEAHEYVEKMNREGALGHNDWRVPFIRELESLVDMSGHSPALSPDHPFENTEMDYWSATTSMYETRYAWVLYLQDGAVGVGFKENAEFHLWPVRCQLDPAFDHTG